ncbi:Na+/H+ antiporter NhaA [Pikeienuella sp. HZG-20]|uniref:Na+/H+ antiporter NhaA n=1 Tax=Paludibacillus litoralis TaxID=3133267 RepID=UPI0030EF4F92
MDRTATMLLAFMKKDTSGGIVLMIAAIAAIVAGNTAISPLYSAFLDAPVVLRIGALEIAKPAVLWINDGLMAIFFFHVGLEIKREVLEGDLSSFDKAALPALAALGGMAGPALIYVLINSGGDPTALNGWAIPAATDIAFALGVLALVGRRAPIALKVLLLAIAIIDDLGAIVIIAFFYTADLSTNALLLAGGALLIGALLGWMRVKSLAPYIILGAIMWVCVLKSGVHATLAGVMIALCVPLNVKSGRSPLRRAEHGLHLWVAFFVLPLFAFANAGVSLAGLSLDQVVAPVPLGVALGLFVGKQVGVMSASFAAVKLGVAALPKGLSWRHVYGLACLTGVGFTMSLFIGSLAFSSAETMNEVRLGVLMGSFASGLLGYTLLMTSGPAPAREPERA